MSHLTAAPLTQLHLGLGSFHRAHQAAYMHALHQAGDKRWCIVAGNIRPDMAETIAALQAQQGAYTLETIDPHGGYSYERIESIKRVIAFTPDLAGLTAEATAANTRIISFTVTEAGYYLRADYQLDWAYFPDLRRDLKAVQDGHTGQTIYGALVLLLRARMQTSAGPVTLLNCDNLRHNGDRLRHGLLQFVEALGDTALLNWIKAHTSSPNAMVDRITPRPTLQMAARVEAATGWADAAVVMSELFTQWVIEDRFVSGRPEWEMVGVEMVASVDAYEEAKIRLLNATHSCIAWAGTLAGYQYIHEGVLDLGIREMAYRYVTDDAIPVLDTPSCPSPIDLPVYRDVVLERFANVAIQDTNQRVAMDAFSKIPGMITPTIRSRLAQNASIDSVAMLPALFLAYLQRWHRSLLAYTYQDQAMHPAVAHAICTAPDPVVAFAADTTLFGDVASDPRLVQALQSASMRVEQFILAYHV